MKKWVPSLDWLKETAQQGGGIEVSLHLNGGLISRKKVDYNAGEGWYVFNYIDDSELEGLSDEQLGKQTNIIMGINQNALSYDTDDVIKGED